MEEILRSSDVADRRKLLKWIRNKRKELIDPALFSFYDDPVFNKKWKEKNHAIEQEFGTLEMFVSAGKFRFDPGTDIRDLSLPGYDITPNQLGYLLGKEKREVGDAK